MNLINFDLIIDPTHPGFAVCLFVYITFVRGPRWQIFSPFLEAKRRHYIYIQVIYAEIFKTAKAMIFSDNSKAKSSSKYSKENLTLIILFDFPK